MLTITSKISAKLSENMKEHFDYFWEGNSPLDINIENCLGYSDKFDKGFGRTCISDILNLFCVLLEKIDFSDIRKYII